MKTEKQVSAAGVFVEFANATGIVGQALFTEWSGRPLPAVGDTFACDAFSTASGRIHKLRGVVRARHFEVQAAEDGAPSVWVRLTVDLVTAPELPRRSLYFSRN